MTSASWTSINFDYGGHYSEEGVWNRRESHMYTLMIVEPFEDTTYDRLVAKICRKIKVDETTTKLKITYTKLVADGNPPSVVLDDEDVYLYLMRWKDGIYGMLHVEPLDLEIRLGEDRSSRVVVRNDGLLSDGRDKSGTISLNTQSEHNLLLDNGSSDEEEEREETHYDQGYDICDGVEITETVERNEIVNREWDDGINMIVGQEFESKQEVQDLIAAAAHTNCFSVETKRSNRQYYVVKCGDAGCEWGLRLAKLKNSERFTLRIYRKMHTCSRVDTSTSSNRKKGTARLVASVLQDHFQGQIETPTPKSIIGLVQGELGVKVSYSTAWRGKKQAAYNLRGNPKECFQRIPSYLHMLKQVNPGTMTYVECDENSRFKYLFIALGACIEGFNSMRKVIIMDGTHIKNGHGGTLLFAVAQDPDHHHYPIAFGVVDGAENHDGWEWFLEKLKISVPDDPNLVFVTDRHQSIIEKVRHVYPQSIHGYCMYHLCQNVKVNAHNVNKDEVGRRFTELARVYTEAEFYPLYVAFCAKYPDVFEYLTESVYEDKWARCYFPGERYNIDTTNCVESMNSVFRKARHYSILPMLDAIVEKISEWFNKYRKLSAEVPRTQKLVPRVNAELHERCRAAAMLQVHELNSFLREYNVIGRDGNCYLVDLRNKTCSCKHFDIDKYPCEHAIAAAMAYSKNGNVLDLHELCSPYYLLVNWEMAYCKTIYPVPSLNNWNIPQDILDVKVIPPRYKRSTGRPKTARIPSVGEPRRKPRTSTTTSTI